MFLSAAGADDVRLGNSSAAVGTEFHTLGQFSAASGTDGRFLLFGAKLRHLRTAAGAEFGAEVILVAAALTDGAFGSGLFR